MERETIVRALLNALKTVSLLLHALGYEKQQGLLDLITEVEQQEKL